MYKIAELTNPDSCLNRARDDEMVFVLLARDVVAPNVIRVWAEERIMYKKNNRDDPQIIEAWECAKVMEAYRPTATQIATGTNSTLQLIANLIKQRDLLALAMKELIDRNPNKAGQIVDIVKAMGVKPEVPMADECRRMYGIDI